MPRLSDVSNAAVQTLLAYRNVTPAAAAVNLAINAAGAATVKTNTAIQYLSNGVIKYKAALAAQSLAVSTLSGLNYVQPANTTVYYTLGLDGAGNVAVIQGSYAGQTVSANPTAGLGVARGGTSWNGDGAIPDVPAGYTPFGVIKVATTSASFTPGTTALDAAGVSATYFDIAVLPAGAL